MENTEKILQQMGEYAQSSDAEELDVYIIAFEAIKRCYQNSQSPFKFPVSEKTKYAIESLEKFEKLSQEVISKLEDLYI